MTLANRKILAAADPTPGVTVLDGLGATWLLDVTDATVQGLTLRRGMRAEGGGAVHASGDVLLECVVADHNHTAGGEAYGGAVRAEGSLTVRSSAFGWNDAGYAGGAIFAETLVVEDTSFSENTSGYEGGALDTTVSLEVRRSFFTDNQAGYEGGGLSGYGRVDIEDTSFVTNRAANEGGALSIGAFDPVTLAIRSSTFEDNEAQGSGGALSIGAWATDPTTITDSTFVGNRSGGVAVVDFGTWGGVDLTVTGCTFTDNEGQESGVIGSSGWLDDGGTVVLASSVFEDNVALGAGGGIFYLWSENGPVLITGTDLVVLRNSGGEGALSLGHETHVLDCTNCDFGAGADDNVPGDATKAGVQVANLPLDFVL